VTTRYERMKMQRQMQRRIRLVVEERRMALGRAASGRTEPTPHAEPGEATVEIPLGALLRPVPAPPAPRAIGRVTVRSA
jgi:hypothetical protein